MAIFNSYVGLPKGNPPNFHGARISSTPGVPNRLPPAAFDPWPGIKNRAWDVQITRPGYVKIAIENGPPKK